MTPIQIQIFPFTNRVEGQARQAACRQAGGETSTL